MKKIYLMIFLLFVTLGISAQKITIKTSNGQQVEISCEGSVPTEIIVVNDSVVLRLPTSTAEQSNKIDTLAVDLEASEKEEEDSVDTFVPVEEDVTSACDSIPVDSLSSSANYPSGLGFIANYLMEEISPEYAEFNKEHANDHPESEKDVIKSVAKQFINEDAVETADLVTTLFSGLRFTKDTTFVAKYEQRKPKDRWRTYNTIVLEGSFGRNIEGVSDEIAEKVNIDDYGDDTSNENKFGGGISFSHIYLYGNNEDGKFKPNPLGLAFSWGGLLSYSYEQDMGSYVSAMAKGGIQIGYDIAIGIDGLVGCGITPYNSFYTNGINHSMLNKSAFCFKYGIQLWGSLNFSNSTYTEFYGRYVRSVKPSSALTNLPNGWDMIVEDFDPSNWTIGLAVGYKFGDLKPLSQDKRLQASLSAGYTFLGEQKGTVLSAEIEKITQVSHSTSLNFGLAIKRLLGENEKENYSSLLFSAGFKVMQPYSKWFWGTKLYGGVGDYQVSFIGNTYSHKFSSLTKKLCAKFELQLNTGLKIGKCSEIFAACNAGYYTGKHIDIDGFDETSYDNLNGFEMSTSLGYRFTF